ncbi:MAG: hypothetical protein ACK5JP_07910, partial [Akkermansiaceae bacterium]
PPRPPRPMQQFLRLFESSICVLRKMYVSLGTVFPRWFELRDRSFCYKNASLKMSIAEFDKIPSKEPALSNCF